ncbi:MAG TPA: glycine cleavage system aminomethyltransferase GcvT [Bacteroidia bacterium]|nr:glycine cleavage system aminomethyltransferase GcvT [Bacteroidia bacterium]
MKKTPFHSIHTKLNAKMVPFAGYEMPVQYEGLLSEHHCVRNNVGIFDVSHMGEFILKGPDAINLIQKVTSNDASKLSPGKAQYSCFPNEEGGIIDDLIVYQIEDSVYMLVVNASNIDKDWNWIKQHDEWNVEMHNISDQTALLAVQGPNAKAVLQKLCTKSLDEIAYYHFIKDEFAGIPNVVISNTGYTGAGGFEIYFDNKDAELIWNKLMEAGKEFNIQPCGLGARDTLRLEMGFCLYGNDIDDSTSPIEAGLGWITKFTKEFINYEFLKTQKENGVDKKLVGFEMIERGIPRHGYEITDGKGSVIGRVSSGTQSPTLSKAIGLGYIPTAISKGGSEIYVKIIEKEIKAIVCSLPFLKKN